jgi:hypothetical protein
MVEKQLEYITFSLGKGPWIAGFGSLMLPVLESRIPQDGSEDEIWPVMSGREISVAEIEIRQ